MKKRDIIIDLTVFLDVILIMMFLVLTQNVGEIFEYRTQVYALEIQRFNAEQERTDAENALAETNERLAALSDWDNERMTFTSELENLNEWRAVVESAVHIIAINMYVSDSRRVINIKPSAGAAHEIDIVWDLDGRNVIVNEDSVLDELNAALSDIIRAIASENPVLIMLNYDGIARQEYALIIRGIRSFINIEEHGFNIYYASYANN